MQIQDAEAPVKSALFVKIQTTFESREVRLTRDVGS